MTVQLVTRPVVGSTVIFGDTLAAVLHLSRDEHGTVSAACPICWGAVTGEHDPDGGPMRVQLFDGVAYGRGVLEPCGHPIGAIGIAAGEREPEGPTDA